MKVFVGFGYNAADEWISDLIIPFIEAMGCQVETGEEMQGEELALGVKSRIEDCDTCIGFLTKRGDTANADGFFPTHKWVIEELAIAQEKKKPIFEIREKGVDPQRGITGNLQHYIFDDRALLMLEIAKFISKEKRQIAYKTFMLLPSEFGAAIRPHLKFARCSYKFLFRAREYAPEETPIVKMQGGYAIIIKKIPDEEASVDITISCPAGSWSSGYVSVGLMNIHLQQDN